MLASLFKIKKCVSANPKTTRWPLRLCLSSCPRSLYLTTTLALFWLLKPPLLPPKADLVNTYSSFRWAAQVSLLGNVFLPVPPHWIRLLMPHTRRALCILLVLLWSQITHVSAWFLKCLSSALYFISSMRARTMSVLDAIIFLRSSILPALGRYSVNIRISEGVNSGQIYRA